MILRRLVPLGLLLACPISLTFASSRLPVHTDIGSRAVQDWDYDGKQILGHIGNEVCLWDASSGRLLHRMIGHDSAINSVHFSEDGARAISSAPASVLGYEFAIVASVILWDLKTGKPITKLAGQRSGMLSPDGARILSFSNATTLNEPSAKPAASLWDAASGRLLLTVKDLDFGSQGETFPAYFVRDGKAFVVLSWQENCVYDATNGKRLAKAKLEGGPKVGVGPPAQIGPRGRLIATFASEYLAFYDEATLKLLRRLPVASRNFLGIGRDGRTLIAPNTGGRSHTISFQVWDLKTGKMLYDVTPPEGGVYDAAVSPDGNYCLLEGFSENSTWVDALLYDLKRKQVVARINLGLGRLIAFSPDSKTFLVRGLNLQPFVIYDAHTGKELKRLNLVPVE